MWYYTCAALLLIGGTYASLPLPSYIPPCATSSPDFNKCALERARSTIPHVIKGDRIYKIPAIDPLSVTEIKVDNSGPKQAGIAFTLKNCKFYGPGDAEVNELDLDFDKKKLHLRVNFPRIMILGKYDVKGRVLLLPITGKGDVNVTIVNADVVFETDLEKQKRKGKEYVVLTNPRVPSAIVERAYFDLQNLFNGDKLLGPEMNRVLNENWKESFEELSPPVLEALSTIVTSIVNGISGSVPMDVAFPETV